MIAFVMFCNVNFYVKANADLKCHEQLSRAVRRQFVSAAADFVDQRRAAAANNLTARVGNL